MDETLNHRHLPQQRPLTPADLRGGLLEEPPVDPTRDPGEAARLLHRRLFETNRVALPWSIRLRLLVAVAPAVDTAHRLLRTRLHAHETPLGERALRLARLLRDLLFEEAIGYLAVAAELIPLHHPRRDQMLGLALYGALRQLGCALLTTSQAALPRADELWRLAHRSHAVALRAGLAQFRPERGALDLADCYKRALLFAAAEPRESGPAEQAELYRALAAPAAEVALLSHVNDARDALTFVVDPWGGTGPVPVGSCGALSGRELLLPLGGLGAALAERSPLLASAHRRWLARAAGAQPRAAAGGSVEVTVGLERIHARLQLEGPAPWEGFVPEDESSEEVAPISSVCEIRDLSPQGLRIATAGLQLPLGEVVALRCSDASHLRIGVVRWSLGHEAGVGIWCGLPVAVWVRREHQQLRALLLEGSGGAELLLPARRFSADQSLRVQSPQHGEEWYRLHRPLEESALFTRFALGNPQAAPAPQAEDDFVARFGILWAGL